MYSYAAVRLVLSRCAVFVCFPPAIKNDANARVRYPAAQCNGQWRKRPADTEHAAVFLTRVNETRKNIPVQILLHLFVFGGSVCMKKQCKTEPLPLVLLVSQREFPSCLSVLACDKIRKHASFLCFSENLSWCHSSEPNCLVRFQASFAPTRCWTASPHRATG